MAYRILIVDDEEDILQLLKDYLELQGYMVFLAHDGKEAINKASLCPDLIILDINMPDIDGFDVCKRLRQHLACPIIFLTARVTEQDKVRGLMIGGDDYIIKPFSIDELGARITAHLRRESRSHAKRTVRFIGDITVNIDERCMYYKDDAIPLTKKEFDIVEFLCMNKGQVFSKEKIYEKLWGYDSDGDSNIVTEHIRRIRQKIAKYSDKPLIATVWGVGYKWIG